MKRLAVLLVLFMLLSGIVLGACRDSQPTPAPPVQKLTAAFATPGQVGPFVYPPSWLQATWYTDGQNTTGCASDNNRTCSSSACTSGDGPCKTFGSIYSRWGTYSPILPQITTINVISGMSNKDPILSSPTMQNTSGVATPVAYLTYVGVPTVVATTTLGAITAKNRSTPQLLNAVINSGSATATQFAVNSTNASVFWVYSNVSGSTWALSQPMTSLAIGSSLATISEVNYTSGDNGDTVALETFPSVTVANFTPQSSIPIASAGNPYGYLQHLNITGPSFGSSQLGLTVVTECIVGAVNVSNDGNTNPVVNVYGLVSSWIGTAGDRPLPYNYPSLDVYAGTSILAGVLLNGSYPSWASVVDYDVILDNIYWSQTTAIGEAYMGTGSTFAVAPGATVSLFGETLSGTSVLWGPGQINVHGQGRLAYKSGAGGYATSILVTGEVSINNTRTMCCNVPSDAAAGLVCGLSTSTVGIFDAYLGANSGCCLQPGGGSICNTPAN